MIKLLASLNQSIVSHTLMAVGVRILFVISILTTISYFHIFSEIESTKLAEFQSFTQERVARESQIFTLAEDNHKLFKQDILNSYQPENKAATLSLFERDFIRQDDHAIRFNPQLFDAEQRAGVWIAKDVQLTDELKYRAGLLNTLVGDYGKSWRNRFINTYAYGIENFAAIYWPEIPDFTYRLAADFDIRLEEYFTISIEQNNPAKKTVWTGVYLDKQSDIWMVSIETPIYYQQQHIATIGNDMSLDELFARTINQAPQGGYNLIFRHDGRLIAHQSYIDQLKAANGQFIIDRDGDDSLQSIYHAVITADPNQKMIELAQIDSYLMVSKLSGPGWYYVSVIPKTVVSNVASSTAMIVFISGFIALGIELFVLFFVMRKKITQPLSKLNHATLALSRGEQAEKLDNLRTDELGRLASAFNTMNQNLIKRDNQLASANKALEVQLHQIQLSENNLANAQAAARLGSWQYDTVSHQLTLSRELVKLLQLTPFQVDTFNIEALFNCLAQNDNGAISDVFKQFLEQGVAFSLSHELMSINDKHECCYVHSTGQVEQDGKRLTGTVQDLSEQYKAEQAKKQSEQLFRNVFNNSTISMAVVGLDGKILQANKTLCKTFGYTNDEIYLLSYVDLLQPDDREFGYKQLALIRDADAKSYDAEITLVCKNGTELCCYINVYVQKNIDGLADYIFIQCIDISLRKQAEVKLNQLAFHDPLTHLANRTLFIEFLTKAVKQYKRDAEYNFALLFLDLDGFKLVNDSLGHLEGDKLLIAIAERLSHEIRNSDTLARFGGDEFCILMECITGEAQVIKLAERINRALTKPFILNNEPVVTNASIGIVLASNELLDAQEYLRDADSAMYHAKREGRGGYAIFNEDMHMMAKHQLRLRNELSQAVTEKQFIVYFQPIINATTGRIAGFEALVRWLHPTKGLIEPIKFLSIAEEMRRIAEIDYLVIDQALGQITQWREQFRRDDLTVSCNASSDLISTYHVVDKLKALLNKHGLPAHCLNIEVTENVLIHDPETTMKILYELQATGVNIHLDDFGTGFSSLSYLHRFPIHNIKIDRSFVSRLMNSEKDHAIVESIVLLANRLGIEITAEGVETVAQYHALQKIGATKTQGYYHSKPVDSGSAMTLLFAEQDPSTQF
ncbi:EAL domain-containing protein [Shewanella sp. OMA3-2]|uniref:EAL domain-containing protein n=1 Tax=Shewanella sp. OMA3-2 TaxID=2908650 RepID=UPI001F1813EC|nr:EAL domain-containing protein [Shewanella sp. OMA3-2]UJF20861.1 EAL domain-containing protein [Shewanella sp. OMA3-2]